MAFFNFLSGKQKQPPRKAPGRSAVSSAPMIIKAQDNTADPKAQPRPNLSGDILGRKIMQDVGYNMFSPNVAKLVLNNPDPISSVLQTSKGLAIYKEMELHPAVKSSARTRRNKLLRKNWDIFTAEKSADPEDVRRRGWLLSKFQKIDAQEWDGNTYYGGFNALLVGIWDMLRMGYSGNQAVWNLSEAAIVGTVHEIPQAFEWRDEDGKQSYRYTGTQLWYVPGAWKAAVKAPPCKFIMGCYDREYDSPHGTSIYQPAYWAWFFGWLHAFKWWATFLNKDAEKSIIASIPKLWYENTDMVNAISDSLLNLHNNTVATLPENPETHEKIWEVLESQRGSTTDVYQNFLKFTSDWIVMSILGELLTTQEPTLGNRALGEVQSEDTGGAYIGSDADAVQAVINSQPLRWMYDMKFGKPQPRIEITTTPEGGSVTTTKDRDYPEFRFVLDKAKDTAAIANTLNVERKMMRISDAWAREQLGIPPVDEAAIEAGKDSILEQTDPVAPGAFPGVPPTLGLSDSHRPNYRRMTGEQLDAAVEQFMRGK
jgi:hypothetical protein